MQLNFKTTIVNKKEAQFLKLNNQGIKAVFYPANGFPLGTYSKFLKLLSSTYELNCLSLRSCWPNIGKPPTQINWEVFADDLIAFVEQQYNEPIVAIGHSQGATAILIAASKRPELFNSLILIEPASVSEMLGYLVKLTPYFIKKHFQPFKSGLKKQDIWKSKEEFYNYCRNNKAYKRISDDVLKDFVEFGLEPIENGKFTLTFPAKWEAANYALAPSIYKYLRKIKIPIQVIAGKPSLFFSIKVRNNWKRISLNTSITVNSKQGHLFPLEAPENCVQLIKLF